MISFIVPAYNEEQLLEATLDAITASARSLNEAFEIIVVNDGSTDCTEKVASDAGVRVLTVNVRQIAAARNAGAQEALGEFFIFVDADTLVNPSVVAAALAVMRAGAVGGGAMVVWEGALPSWARALAAITLWTMRAASLAAGCFVFATRTAFNTVGGFDSRLYVTEELTLSRSLNRLGRFVILQEHVVTSGRKLRTYSALEFLRMTAAVLRRGWRGRRDRRHLSLWYGERRNE